VPALGRWLGTTKRSNPEAGEDPAMSLEELGRAGWDYPASQPQSVVSSPRTADDQASVRQCPLDDA
jgi:hypothetical protein